MRGSGGGTPAGHVVRREKTEAHSSIEYRRTTLALVERHGIADPDHHGTVIALEIKGRRFYATGAGLVAVDYCPCELRPTCRTRQARWSDFPLAESIL
jgi:hypothetical protein